MNINDIYRCAIDPRITSSRNNIRSVEDLFRLNTAELDHVCMATLKDMSEGRDREVEEDVVGPNGEELIPPSIYLSSKWGYVPHSNQIRMTCPKCGNGTFKSFAQAVNVEAPIWCFEHVCASCGQGYGIEVIRKEAKE